jgi:hypothetical protein
MIGLAIGCKPSFGMGVSHQKNDSIVLENSHYGYSHLEKSASFQASQIHNVLQHFLGSLEPHCDR